LRHTRIHFDYELKLAWAKARIRRWLSHWGQQCYVSFSGGKDSTVLLHLVREQNPTIPAVYVNSGLEFPEVTEFVKQTDNVTWLRPSKSFKQVIEQHGYPVVSQRISRMVDDLRNGKHNQKTKKLYLTGGKYPRFKFPKKWKFLLDAPFPISAKCCTVMKKSAFWKYERRTGRVPFVGLLATESRQRLSRYLNHQCNLYTATHPTSSPLSLWTEADIWRYIEDHRLPYASCYDLGYPRTGCLFCLFGIQYETEPNRIQRLAQTHPRLYTYCLEQLDLRTVLDYLNVPYD